MKKQTRCAWSFKTKLRGQLGVELGSADPAALDVFLASVDAVMQQEGQNGYGDANLKLRR